MQKTGEEIFLHYKGLIQYNTISQLISDLKAKMQNAGVKSGVYKKVLMVMIESLENAFKYHEFFEKDKKITELYPPAILITRNNNSFKVQCSNPIREKDITGLRNIIDKINLLDKEGVKDAYKQIITNGKFSDKGGAGLGIIEMAKISDDKIKYSFTPTESEYYIYNVSVQINCN